MDTSGLPPLPSFIVDKIGDRQLVNHALEHNSSAPEKGGGAIPTARPGLMDTPVNNSSQCWMSPKLKKAIIAGDYKAVKEARDKHQQDLEPNLTTIRNDKSKAAGFQKVTDKATGQEYFLCASNSGWFWSFTTHLEKPNTNGQENSECVVQVGSFTEGSSLLSTSHQKFSDVPKNLSALAAAAFAAFTVGILIKNILLGKVYQTALGIAVAAAEEGVVEGGLMISAAAASFAATILAVVGGAIVAVVIIAIATDFFFRTYGLTISVYNWDTKMSWTVEEYYGENAVISNASPPWKVATLLPVQNTLPGPIAPIPVKEPSSQYASYCFVNDKNFLEGLSLALRVTTASGAGFNVGYEIRRLGHNLMGVSSNPGQGLQEWYKDWANWRASGTTSYTGKIDGRDDLTVTIMTSALDGDRAYTFDVHIGVAQSNGT